jgi:hypothetical protein
VFPARRNAESPAMLRDLGCASPARRFHPRGNHTTDRASRLRRSQEKNAAPEGLAESANEIVEIALEIEPRNFR